MIHTLSSDLKIKTHIIKQHTTISAKSTTASHSLLIALFYNISYMYCRNYTPWHTAGAHTHSKPHSHTGRWHDIWWWVGSGAPSGLATTLPCYWHTHTTIYAFTHRIYTHVHAPNAPTRTHTHSGRARTHLARTHTCIHTSLITQANKVHKGTRTRARTHTHTHTQRANTHVCIGYTGIHAGWQGWE